MENDRGNGATRLTKSQRKRKRKSLKRKLQASSGSFDKREDVENPKSKLVHPCFYIISMSSLQDKPNTGLGTVANVDQMKTVSSTATTSDVKSLISRSEGHREIAKGETGISRTTSDGVKSRYKREECMETANDMRGSSKNTPLDVIGSHDSKSTVSKRKRRLKIANDEVVSSETAIIDANTRSKRKEYMETAIDDTVPGKHATPDAKTVSKGEEQTIVADGELGSTTATKHNVADMVENKKKRSRRMKPTCGELLNLSHLKDVKTAIDETCSGNTASRKRRKKQTGVELLNLPHLKDMKTAIDETCSSTTATDNTASKTKKGQRSKNKNPDSGDILSTSGSMQNMVIAKEGSSTTKVLESTCGEMVSGKTATPDAKMVSKGEELTKPVSDKMCSSATTILNVNGTLKDKKKLKSKNKRTTIGEIVNPKCLQDNETANGETGSVTIVADDAASKKERGQKGVGLKKKKPASGDILSAGESTHDRGGIEALIPAAIIIENKEVMANNEIPHVATSRKKLLIIDVNGLLADIVYDTPKGFKPDIDIQGRAIFKRPFLDDFMCFCFERFDVAIWSSIRGKVLNPVISYLLRDLKNKLLFVWDASECTKTQTMTLENKNKCMVFKDLRKIWQKNNPGGSWVIGAYHESNTLLVDNSPYKALLNPKHTGVFPVSYSYLDRNDDSLGPNGDLRTYLEGLAAADDVKTYVEHHPFGQGAIDETNPDWAFYSQVVRAKGYKKETVYL